MVDAGARGTAAIHSPIAILKLRDIEARANPRRAIGCIADHPVNRVDELVPW